MMANIKDVAHYANVSVTTVSRVLNGHPYVTKEKREAVEEAIEALHYRQNMNAIHLSKGKTRLLGVVIPFVDHPYFSLLLNGMSKEALNQEHTLVLIQTNYDAMKEMEALEMLKYKQIDGLIIASRSNTWDVVEDYTEFGPIVVCEDRRSDVVSSVSIRHYDAFYEGMQHLIEKGHQKIGFCIARKEGTNSQLRYQAFRDALFTIQAGYKEEWIFSNCLSIEDGERVVEAYQLLEEKPTALLVTSDQVAAGIRMECQKRNIAVPDELAILGFDNHAIARALDLSTIELPLHEVGRKLVTSALDGNKTIYTQYGFSLIERGSV